MRNNAGKRGVRRAFKKATKDAPRLLAFEIFKAVIRDDQYSNLLLNHRLNDSKLELRDRAFVTELVYGSIRQIGRNDYIISKFSSKALSELDPGILDVLRLGAYQLFDMRIPNHASVSATVDLARNVIGESKASYVNAIMRKMSESTLEEHLIEVQDDSIPSLSIRYSHPEWIVNSYRDHFSDIKELKAALDVNNQPVAPTLVAWPGKSSQAQLVELGAIPTKYSQFGAVTSVAPSSLELIKSRRAGVQDEGSQIIAIIFANVAKEHEPWLDLCAGPGGKAALLSHLASDKFYANEISPNRAALVSQVVKDGTTLLQGDGRQILEILRSEKIEINAVIADVPCTGLGALRRRPEVRWRRKVEDLPELLTLQQQLAQAAVAALTLGDIFAYVTCSPHLAETVSQCINFERSLPLEKIDISNYLPNNLEGAVKDGYLQLWPHRHKTDAMFMAIYRKR